VDRSITLWLPVRPSIFNSTKTNWLTNTYGIAAAVNSRDEEQNSDSAEYPRRTGDIEWRSGIRGKQRVESNPPLRGHRTSKGDAMPNVRPGGSVLTHHAGGIRRKRAEAVSVAVGAIVCVASR
jgi:hypothetical protein